MTFAGEGMVPFTASLGSSPLADGLGAGDPLAGSGGRHGRIRRRMIAGRAGQPDREIRERDGRDDGHHGCPDEAPRPGDTTTTTGTAGATSAPDAVAPGHLVEPLRRHPPVVGDARGRAPRPRRRRAASRVGAEVRSGSIGTPRVIGAARRGRAALIVQGGGSAASRSRRVAWARLRIEPTLPGLVRR